jgi:hypothetical protein
MRVYVVQRRDFVGAYATREVAERKALESMGEWDKRDFVESKPGHWQTIGSPEYHVIECEVEP